MGQRQQLLVDSNAETKGPDNPQGSEGNHVDNEVGGNTVGINGAQNGGNNGENGDGPSITYEERVADLIIVVAGISRKVALKLATLVGKMAEIT